MSDGNSVKIELFGYATSPYVMKVKTFLDFKRLDFHFTHVRPVTNEQIAFTGQRQVPVLKIGDEWRTESSQLGLWLDELYPDRPLLFGSDDARRKIMEIDAWISDMLIPSMFREVVDWGRSDKAMRNGWRLAHIVNSRTPIPLHWRLLWPFALRKAGFIQQLIAGLDRKEPIAAMHQRIAADFIARLDGGPFLGGLAQPSLADCSAFPIVSSGYLMGMNGPFFWTGNQEIESWLQRMQQHLPDNPLPCDDHFIARSLTVRSGA